MRANRNNTMYCPEEKALEMSRTLLAANRNAARSARKNKRNWHSKRRTAQRNIDRRFEGISVDNAFDMIDDYEQATQPRTEATFAKVEGDRKYDVFYRREGDRLGLYFRWAEQVTDHLGSPDERMRYIAETTPTDPFLISHALEHLSFTPKFRGEQWRWWDDVFEARSQRRRAKRAAYLERMKDLIREALMGVIECGNHRRFNKMISSYKEMVYKRDLQTGTREIEFVTLIRPFEGLHDIDDYSDEVYRVSHLWHTTVRREERIIRALELCTGMKISS